MLVKRGEGAVYHSRPRTVSRSSTSSTSRRRSRRAGIYESEVWLHKFRATFAAPALWAGFDLRTVQDWMGRTALASTLPYLKPNRNQVREKVEAIWATA
jgi:integrase/recombinase XerD